MPQVRDFRRMHPLNVWLALAAATLIAHGQETQGLGYTQTLKAAVVLTPEFCKTSSKKGSFISSPDFPLRKESFAVGPAACRQVGQALKSVFSSVAEVEKEPIAGSASAQVVLIPKFVDISATRPGGPAPAFSERELVVLLEWTVMDAAGKPIWIETVQGSAKHRMGSIFTGDKKRIIEDAVKNLLETSARKMSEAAELRTLAR